MKKKNEIILWCVLAIILAVIYEAVCLKLEVYASLNIARIGVITTIIIFIGLHLILGAKTVYDFIIDKRYIIAVVALVLLTVLGLSGSSMGAISSWILEPEANNTILGTYRYIRSDEYAVEALVSASQKNEGMLYFSSNLRGTLTDVFLVVHAPVKDILSLGKIYNIGYLFLNFDMAYSFAYNFRIIALILVTFEFFQIITKKNKYYSLAGAVIISFSSFIAWWNACDIIIFGELALIAIDKFMNSDKFKMRIAWSAVLAFSAISYVFTFYPAYMVSFGYIFLAVLIWIIIKNAKNYKFQKTDLLCVLLFVAVVALFMMRFYSLSQDTISSLLNTSYPGDRAETGGNGLKYLFSYIYDFLLPFVQTDDNMVYATFLSFFPLPIIMAAIYIYKKEDHASFLFPMLVVLVVLSIWCISGMPEILGKITLLKFVPTERCAVAVALGCVYLYMYMLSNIKESYLSFNSTMKITLVLLVLSFLVRKPDVLNSSKGYMYLLAAIATLSYFLLLNSSDKRYTNLFLKYAVVLTLIGGVFVNPITQGTSIITETKLAKAVQEEVEEDSDSLWITENMDMVVSNYLVAQGAKTLNSTNTYPNEEFFETILGDKLEEYREVWNRYAHIRILLTSEETSIYNEGNDRIVINLNYEKLAELNVKYIVSYKARSELEVGDISLEEIYKNEVDEPVNIEGEDVSTIYIYEIVN